MARPPARRPQTSRIPIDAEPERAILATVLSRPETFADIIELQGLRSDDFGIPILGQVWESIVSLDQNGRPLDRITVADELRRSGVSDEIADSTLSDIEAAAANANNVDVYVKMVQDNAHLRRCLSLADEIAAAATAPDADAEAVVQQAEELAFKLVSDKPSSTLQLATEHMGEVLTQITTPRSTPLLGHSTGWAGLDKLTAGFEGGSLIIGAGRPATGKSVFGLQIALHIAEVSGDAVAYLSWEMTSKELLIRALASMLGFDSLKLRMGQIPPDMIGDLNDAAARLGTLPLYLDDQPPSNINSIRAQMRRLHRRTPLACIVMDYLQLIEGDPRLANQRHLQLGQISRGAKLMAKELDVPVIALAQVNREVEKRPGFRPVLADLKDSGCLVASTRLLRADTDGEITLGELVESGETPLVWSMDEDGSMVPSRLTKAFPSGVKQTYRLTLASGEVLEGSGNHPFRKLEGWVRLDSLIAGDSIATFDGKLNYITDKAFTTPEPKWARVVSVEPLGDQEVFDATVEGTHNFVANGIIAHNSLEQDANMVIFLNRPAAFDDNYLDKQEAMFIIAKNRSGPVGDVPVRFQAAANRFLDLSDPRNRQNPSGFAVQQRSSSSAPPPQTGSGGFMGGNDIEDPWA